MTRSMSKIRNKGSTTVRVPYAFNAFTYIYILCNNPHLMITWINGLFINKTHKLHMSYVVDFSLTQKSILKKKTLPARC